jgi:hypothetical protein
MNKYSLRSKKEVKNMPGFDRTGPLGQGSMTGRGMGPCGSGYARGVGRGAGRGFGRGMGRGFGRAAGFAPAWGSSYGYQPTRDQEIADLRAEKEAITEELKQLNERLKELETKK